MADNRRGSDPVNIPNSGIFSLFFREAGAFCAVVYDRAEIALKDIQSDTRAREERRRTEAQTRLLEEMRRAKEAGLDPDAVLRRFQG